MVGIEGSLFLYGGKLKDFRKLPNEVIPLSCHCSIADGDKIYIYGGLNSFGVAQNKFYSYNIKSDRLKEEVLKKPISLD
eukprot:gene11249-4068_t